MRNRLVWALAGIALGSVAVLAQSAPTDTLSALLGEVRQLRIVMERAATSGPEIQLLATRLGVQNERLERAARDHDGVKRELDEVSGAITQMTGRVADLDTRVAVESNPDKQRMLAQEQAAFREQLSELTAREPRLRVRESEVAAALSAEQNQWADLNRRLDDVERSLAARGQR
jgi:chromosome segregation ATPase